MKKYTKQRIEQIEALYQKEYYEGLCGTNNTYNHQGIQMRIALNYAAKTGKTNILTETRLSDKIKITPDISIWEKVSVGKNPINPLLSIEITHTTRNDRYSDETIQISFDTIPSLQEAFIYNYKEDSWTRYQRENNGCISKEDGKDYSRLLRIYLKTLLK